MSEKLTEEQLLLLNNLIYRSEFTKMNSDGTPVYKGKTVGYILNIIIDANHGNTQETMTPEEWDAIYRLAESDSKILDLKVTEQYYEPETGAKMACFVDVDKNGNEQAYAVYAGTGANEWRDDCVAGAMADSPQQEKALKWLEGTPYDNIIVSGHSKGGNKAMYVAITSDKVSECYAFDGEGFSKEFCDKYEDEIKERGNKIHLTANYRDFVNILLINIAGETKYIENSIGVANAGEYHAPNSLFKYDENGNIEYSLGEIGTQDLTMEMFHEFTVYLIENATETEKVLSLSVLGELLTKYLGGNDGVVRDDIIGMFGIEAGEIVIRYLTEYLQELRWKNPVKYYKYREAFKNYVRDGYEAFWYYILASLLKESIVGDFLFDNITNGDMLRSYRTAEFFLGGNVVGRNFSESAKNVLIGAAKETEEEAWWRVDRWDCWYEVENFFGYLNLDNYTANVDAYYRKLIDINDASVRDIKNIFEKVYKVDNSYAKLMNGVTDELNDCVLKKLNNVKTKICPSNTTNLIPNDIQSSQINGDQSSQVNNEYKNNGTATYTIPEYAKKNVAPDAKGIYGPYVYHKDGTMGKVCEWNYPGQLSCTYYTLRKLNERGVGYPCIAGPGNGNQWYSNFDTSCELPRYSGNNSLYDLSNGELPQDNIVVSFPSNPSNDPEIKKCGHVMLIDRMEKDESGNVWVSYSDNWPNITTLNGSNEVKRVRIDSFMQSYNRSNGSINGIVVMGRIS